MASSTSSGVEVASGRLVAISSLDDTARAASPSTKRYATRRTTRLRKLRKYFIGY